MQMNLVQYFYHSVAKKRKSDDFNSLKNSCNLKTLENYIPLAEKKIPARRSIPPISMVVYLYRTKIKIYSNKNTVDSFVSMGKIIRSKHIVICDQTFNLP